MRPAPLKNWVDGIGVCIPVDHQSPQDNNSPLVADLNEVRRHSIARVEAS